MTRREINSLTDEECGLFVDALKRLKQEKIYDNYVISHADVAGKSSSVATLPTDRGMAYHGPASLPWNREYLRRFEIDLQRFSDEPVSLPYWDWTLKNEDESSAWPARALGGDGVREPQKKDIEPFSVLNPPFGLGPDGAKLWTAIDANGRAANSLKRHLGGRGEGWPETRLPYDDFEDAAIEESYDSRPYNRSSEDGFRGRMEEILFRVHAWIGGTMLTTVAPNDPAFFLVHCNADRLWTSWQLARSEAQYLLDTEKPGQDTPEGHRIPKGHRPKDWLYPWLMQRRIEDVVPPNATIYDELAPIPESSGADAD
jgi:tyrosinase